MSNKKESELTCAYCQKPGANHRDHVVPRSRGGPDNATNIVMACQSCNSSKGDQLASEWLGEECPKMVLLIEARVNAKLKAVFKGRDRKGAPVAHARFVFTFSETGKVEYIGEIVSESPEAVRLNPVTIMDLWCGYWNPSGELVDRPKSRCRLFLDRDSCLDALDKANRREDRAAS